MTRQPRPVHLEPRPMPADDGFGLNNEQGPFPIWPKPSEKPPEKPIIRSQEWFWPLGFVNCKLLSQCYDLQDQRPPAANRAQDQTEKEPQRSEHESGYNREPVAKIPVSNLDTSTCKRCDGKWEKDRRINTDGILAKDTSRIRWKFVQIRKGEQDFLDTLSSLLAVVLGRDVTAEPLDSARALVHLVMGLPEWTKRTSRLSEESSIVLQSLLRASDPHRVLFIDLPTLLKCTDLTQVAAAISRSVADLGEAYSKMLRSVKRQLFEALDHHGPIEQLQLRGKTVAGISGDFRLDAFNSAEW